jgi:hypothetical protein
MFSTVDIHYKASRYIYIVLCTTVRGEPFQWSGYSYYGPGVMFREHHRSCVDTHDKAELFLGLAFNTNQSAGTLWNSLPASLRNEQSLEPFKKGLQTHLFKIAFVK